MITAPFNFIPLNEKVFFPPWAEDVNHDVPFEDGESGEIDITITAKSPIFVRNSSNNRDAQSSEFCNYKGQYYIPGSSVKGMIRNILEIMSFSKMNQFHDNTYAVRDLSSAKNFYMKQMNLIDKPITQCGWLKKTDDGYIIEDCGTPGRIHHKQIDYALNINFSSKFQKDGFEKTSQYKYDLVNKQIHSIRVGEKYKSEKNLKYDKREFYKFDSSSKNEAKLVLTGQPTKRQNTGKMGDGKGFEFLFFDKKNELHVEKAVFENFKFAYFDGRNTEPKESLDWKFWKEKLKSGDKIPVFFQKERNKVLHFGLSYLYKLPYKYSVKDGIGKIHQDKRKDLSQTIFGYVEGKEAIKGRIQFSHFKAISNISSLKKRTEILGTPRASYYPIYVRQHNSDFKTFMDGDFTLAGRKRYPIHKGNDVVKTEETSNENVGTIFSPLKDGVVFQGKLRYHNLKKVEIGAILSALTFHNTPNVYHNIGMAKSLGYGKVNIKLNKIEKIEHYLKEFEMYMTEEVKNWKNSIQIKELFTMSIEQNNSGNSTLKYMKLQDFAKHKSKTKDYLKCYSELDNVKSVKMDSLIDEHDLENHKLKQQEIKKIQAEKQKEQNDWQKVKASNTIQSFEHFIATYKGSKYIDEAYSLIDKIKELQEKEKLQQIQQEVKEKWEAILKIDNKYKVQALENFIDNYSHSNYINEAKKMLDELKPQQTQFSSSIDFEDLKMVNDSKKFKFILESNEKSLEGNKVLIEDEAIRVYKSLKGKKQKNFFKEVQLRRFLGTEFENNVICNAKCDD